MLDRAFDKAAKPLDEQLTVYRGISGFDPPELFTDRGFISTTTDRDIALKYAGKNGKVVEVSLPKGMRVLRMGDQVFDMEGEILLPRASSFIREGAGFAVNTRYVNYKLRCEER